MNQEKSEQDSADPLEIMETDGDGSRDIIGDLQNKQKLLLHFLWISLVFLFIFILFMSYFTYN